MGGKNSKMVLDVKHGVFKKGTPVIQWPKHGGITQRFRMKFTGKDKFFLYPTKGANVAVGTIGNKLALVERKDRSEFQITGKGEWQLFKRAGKCLDVPGGSKAKY